MNLAHKHEPPQAEVVQFPKQERITMANKQEGYTRTPNYLVDDDYVAEMSGNALKCYVVINRFTSGFSRQNWAMTSGFLQEKTGIKKDKTLTEAVRQLEQFGLLLVERSTGETNKFTVKAPLKIGTTILGTTPENGGGTTPEKGGTKKESKKENIKNDEEEDRTNFQPQNRMLNFVMYHTDDQKFYKLVELAQTYPVDSDFIAQAQVSFPNLNLDRITSEFKKLCQWSLAANGNNPQKWMTTWLNWLSNLTDKPQITKQPAQNTKLQYSQYSAKQSRDDAWAEYYRNRENKKPQFVDVQGVTHD